jgi:hypothetical protein
MMMRDMSEFVWVRAELAGLSDFSAQSDARWRRSSCAKMPN